MPSKYLDPADHIIRQVSWAKLRKNEDESVVFGPLGVAFELRPNEAFLSVSWCDYFRGSRAEKIRCVADAIRRSRSVGAKARFAVATVAAVRACIEAPQRKLRFIHEPTDQDPAHAAIRGWPRDEIALLERLAEEVWCETWTRNDIDRAPASDCTVSQRGSADP